MALNVSEYVNKDWPSVNSEYVRSFEFEVFDLPKVHSFVSGLRPWATGLCVSYIVATFGGQALMKSRPPFRLKGLLTVWNIALAVYSCLTLVRLWPEFWYILNQPNGFYLTMCSREIHSFPTAFWGMLFLASKVIEFGDTAFIVLRKQKLIFLHWYHHVVTFYIGFRMYEVYDPFMRFVIIINSFIHTLMYTYYALKALKFRVSERISRLITTLQIAQMLVGGTLNIFTLYLLENGSPCQRSRETIYTVFGAAVVFLILFSHFYATRYVKPESKAKAKTN